MAGDRPKLMPEVVIQEPLRLPFMMATPEQAQTYAFLENNLRISPQRCLELRFILDELIGNEIRSYRGAPVTPATLHEISLITASVVTRFLELREPAQVEVSSSRVPGEGANVRIKFVSPPALHKLFETNWEAA
jgi:hypothetical protein